MGLSQPREVYGIHSIIPYSRTTYLPYGIVRVLDGGEISLDPEMNDLTGGSNPFAWASEVGTIDSEFSFTCGEYPDFLMELFLGATVTQTAADSDGEATAITAISGTTVPKADTGLASIALRAGEKSRLKMGRYIVVAATGTTVDVYMQSNIDQKRGVELTTLTDAMKITATPLSVTDSAGTTEIPLTGLNLVGGSGTVAMTAGHSGYFDVYPDHSGRSSIVVGASGSTFTEFGARMTAKKAADGKVFEVHALKCRGAGMPIGLSANEFAKPELTMKCLYDSTANRVFEILAVKEVT